MLPKSFHMENRKALYGMLPEDSVLVLMAGRAPRQSADQMYGFFANRNFVYLTGMEEENLVLMAVKRRGTVTETIYLQQPDPMKERWTGRRIHAEDVPEKYGFARCGYVESVWDDLARLSGEVNALWLDFDGEEADGVPEAVRAFAQRVREQLPELELRDAWPLLRDMRTIKKPCEIEAMRKAAVITREGILAMMNATRPGMREYQLKAEFDYALAQRGVLTPAFPSIVCAGKNNFCIHYYDYTGEVRDGDMVLCDVGAWWDNECNDVSRTWPANGRFNSRQAALYRCILDTSDYMFSIIRPGMPMDSVDKLAREYCFTKLKALGLIDDMADIRRLMWHDGAHHVGFDVHDVVNYSRETAPGMVFCVDVGVYCEEWGIGFRLEDNCLVTETGCENLTAAIPRTIEEIEAILAK